MLAYQVTCFPLVLLIAKKKEGVKTEEGWERKEEWGSKKGYTAEQGGKKGEEGTW